MTYRLTIRETFEHVHHIEAESEAEAREKWEHVVVADYDGYGEDAIERTVSRLEALRPMAMEEVKELRQGDRVRWVDPDGGLTTRNVTVETVLFGSDDVVILGEDDDELHCLPEELRKLADCE